MPSETDVAPKAISGRDGWYWKSLGGARLRALSVLKIERPLHFVPKVTATVL